ncbi:MAG: IS630 transposase-related protein [Dehalococcoidia bacterium]
MAHPTEMKARTLALLLTGTSLHEVERVTGIHRRTLARWLRRDSKPLLPAGVSIPGWDFREERK